MYNRIATVLTLVLILSVSSLARANREQNAKPAVKKAASALIDRAIKALGGEEALSKLRIISIKAKTKTTFYGGDGSEDKGTYAVIIQGNSHIREVIEGEFKGKAFKEVALVNDDKGLRKIGDKLEDMDQNGVINQKRLAYLTTIPITLLQLKTRDFTIEMAADMKIDDKPAAGIKVTGPDKTEFKLYFDKESGLPVKLIETVTIFVGFDATQETTYSDYKQMAGIKKATKLVVKRNGDKFQELEITEFKKLDKVAPKTFTEEE